jgi:hypothetical protein
MPTADAPAIAAADLSHARRGSGEDDMVPECDEGESGRRAEPTIGSSGDKSLAERSRGAPPSAWRSLTARAAELLYADQADDSTDRADPLRSRSRSMCRRSALSTHDPLGLFGAGSRSLRRCSFPLHPHFQRLSFSGCGAEIGASESAPSGRRYERPSQ